jgi:hypothetical protein
VLVEITLKTLEKVGGRRRTSARIFGLTTYSIGGATWYFGVSEEMGTRGGV